MAYAKDDKLRHLCVLRVLHSNVCGRYAALHVGFSHPDPSTIPPHHPIPIHNPHTYPRYTTARHTPESNSTLISNEIHTHRGRELTKGSAVPSEATSLGSHIPKCRIHPGGFMSVVLCR